MTQCHNVTQSTMMHKINDEEGQKRAAWWCSHPSAHRCITIDFRSTITDQRDPKCAQSIPQRVPTSPESPSPERVDQLARPSIDGVEVATVVCWGCCCRRPVPCSLPPNQWRAAEKTEGGRTCQLGGGCTTTTAVLST